MTHRLARLAILCGGAALAAAACMHDPTGDEEPGTTTPGGGEAGTGGAATGTSTGSGGAATGTSTGSGGAATGTPTGSGGGAAGVLADTGLITRYYVDERADGQGNATLADAAPNPLELAMTWGVDVNYTEDAGNRGLRWIEIEQDSRASVAVAGTKVSQGLHGSTTGTIELVFQVSAVSYSSSRLSHIGYDSESGSFTLSMPSTTRIYFYKQDPAAGHETRRGSWLFDATTRGRTVVHLVYDSTQADPEDRAKLYLDGAPQPRIGGWPPPQNEVIEIGVDEHYVLGNREIGGRTFVGALYYAALYSAALTEAEVLQNTAVLVVDDDTPG